MRLVHSSDWQIGKTFRFVDDDTAGALRAERLEAIRRLGELARSQSAAAVLVAGDIYDLELPSEQTLRAPLERMRQFPAIEWHLIPGNHDAHTPRGPWERVRKAGLPDNVRLHLAPVPAQLGDGAAWVLPAPLTRRHETGDPTEAMDAAEAPEGAIRIGLAHGSIRSFGTDDTTTHNRIAVDRPARAGLAYLALGDWHGAQQVGERAWYCGTPEPDDFGIGGSGGGEALVVEIDGPRAAPVVTKHPVGRFTWRRETAALHNATDIDVLETRLRGIAPDPASVLVWLTAEGALSLAERAAFEDRIRHGVGSALRALRIDDAALLPRPTSADLDAIDHAGFVRAAADALARRAADSTDPERELAGAALQRLYVLHSKLADARA